MKPIEPDIVEPDPGEDLDDRAYVRTFYERTVRIEDALGDPPSISDAEFVEFLRALEHRFGGGRRRPTRCCRSRRGIRCPFCHPEDYTQRRTARGARPTVSEDIAND